MYVVFTISEGVLALTMAGKRETWTPPLTIAESVVLRDAIQRRGGQDQHVAREPDQGIGIP